jgi:hypothetical protein
MNNFSHGETIMNTETKHFKTIIWAGAGLWAALATVALTTGIYGVIETLVMLAVLVVVPLALNLAAERTEEITLFSVRFMVKNPLRTAQTLQPFAALAIPIAFLLPTGWPAGALALPWLLVCGLIALSGLLNFYQRRVRSIEDFVTSAGLLMIPVGGMHLLLSRLGQKSAGFGEPIVLLTAIHFHYTAFAAPLMAAQLGKRVRATLAPAFPFYAAAALGLVAATPLTAIGFLFSPLLKVIAATLVCASVMALCLLALLIVSDLPTRTTKALVAFSAACGALGMALAAVYASGEFAGKLLLTIPQMAALHGMLNGLGFVTCGLLGWTLTAQAAAKNPIENTNAVLKGVHP